MAGTGGAISFGDQTAAGTYTVVGTVGSGSGCSNTMYGNAVVVINPLPVAYTVTGGGHYCSGTTGADVMLSNSNLGVNYQLLVDAGFGWFAKGGDRIRAGFRPPNNTRYLHSAGSKRLYRLHKYDVCKC